MKRFPQAVVDSPYQSRIIAFAMNLGYKGASHVDAVVFIRNNRPDLLSNALTKALGLE